MRQRGLRPPPLPASEDGADRPARRCHQPCSAFPRPRCWKAGPLQRPHEATAATGPAPGEGGCRSWRTHRKMALGPLPPRLGASKGQRMNNSLSLGFCSQGWPCSPLCNDLVKVEGWRDGLVPFRSAPLEYTAPLPSWFTHPLSECHWRFLETATSLVSRWQIHQNPERVCPARCCCSLPDHWGWRDEQRVTCEFSLPFPLLGYNPLLKLIPKTTGRRRIKTILKKIKADHSSAAPDIFGDGRGKYAPRTRCVPSALFCTRIFWHLCERSYLPFSMIHLYCSLLGLQIHFFKLLVISNWFYSQADVQTQAQRFAHVASLYHATAKIYSHIWQITR